MYGSAKMWLDPKPFSSFAPLRSNTPSKWSVLPLLSLSLSLFVSHSPLFLSSHYYFSLSWSSGMWMDSSICLMQLMPSWLPKMKYTSLTGSKRMHPTHNTQTPHNQTLNQIMARPLTSSCHWLQVCECYLLVQAVHNCLYLPYCRMCVLSPTPIETWLPFGSYTLQYTPCRTNAAIRAIQHHFYTGVMQVQCV